MSELDLLTIGLINDMFTERENDDFKYHRYLDGIHIDREGHKMVAELIANYFKETVR